MYCESTAWGRSEKAQRHPPTFPESAVSVATRAERGGGRCSLKVERQTFQNLVVETWGGGWGADRDWWGHSYIEGWVIKGFGRKSMGNWGWSFNIPVSDRLTARGEQQQRPVKDTNTEGIFHCRQQLRQQSWFRRLKHPDSDNDQLWNFIQSYASLQKSVLFSHVIEGSKK